MKLIDISQPITGNMPTYPGDAPVSLLRYKSLENDGYCAYALGTGMHAGTHIDVPMHLLDDSRFVMDYPPEASCGRGVLIDARNQPVIHPTSEHESAISRGDIVLLHTGADELYGSDAYYHSHAEITPDFAKMLVRKGVKMLGLDAPSPDLPPFVAHTLLLQGGVMLLENLTGLSRIPPGATFEVWALPLRLRAEASPVRAVVCLRA